VTYPICLGCGVQYHKPREHCPICQDERQYVRWDGQAWTTLAELRDDHRNRIEQEGPGLWGIGTEPRFGIGQRALLVQASGGNMLWDCITLLDDETVATVERLGGLTAVAVSHPHFYGTMIEWSRAFGDAPIFVHAADREWVGRSTNVVFWEGAAFAIGEGLTLLNCAVHFPGGTVLHWAGGADGAGALLSGDIVQVVMDRRYVSFMHSYPNLIPEDPETIRHALQLTEPYPFEQIYGAFWKRIVMTDAKAALQRSAQRYLTHAGHSP
jgi:glyoxylase-like metal-dependent hydrolase (beta-lactamase superfamily II)